MSYLTRQILLGMLVLARISIWAKPRFEEAIAESFAESLWVERYLIGVLVADRVVPESTVAVMLDTLEVALPRRRRVLEFLVAVIAVVLAHRHSLSPSITNGTAHIHILIHIFLSLFFFPPCQKKIKKIPNGQII